MTHSVNEINKLAEKAAIGSGFPPAQAEMFGRAAAQHLAIGGEAQTLLDALEDASDSPILRLPLLMDDVLRLAPIMNDPLELTLHPGDETLAPAYSRLLPYAATSCDIMWRDGAQSRLVLTLNLAAPYQAANPARIIASGALLDRLTTLAQRTYVPSSDSSRLNGAGAGLSDND